MGSRRKAITTEKLSNTEWGELTLEEKKQRLYEQQVTLLDTFLKKGAITQQQYAKSFGDLTVKMGFNTTLSKNDDR